MAKNDNGKSTEAKVVEAVEQVEDNLIRLSTGVVLRGKVAAPLALVKVMAAFPRPKPPMYLNKTLGREIENPDDPAYLERLNAHKTENSNAMVNALVLLGTELEFVPKGFPKPTDDEWLDEVKLLNLPMEPDNMKWRYLNWIIFKAAPKTEDLSEIEKVVGRLSGVPESAVKSAEEFPGRK